MELILINSSKLKIMLSLDDMKKYDLDADGIDYDKAATRRAFWSILDDARNQTGFDATSDRLFVQLYPSKAGGCEMYVTKMSVPRLPAARKTEQAVSRDHPFGGREQTDAYGFDTMDALLCVTRRLLALGFEGESSVYRDHAGHLFLILSRYGIGAPLDEFSFILEYGRAENVEQLRLYIREHATCICDRHAVDRLGML